MTKNILLVLLFVSVAFSSMCVAQNFGMLYAKQIQFEYNGAGIILTPGARLGTGQSTVTIPDGTGTVDTSYNNYNQILVALKAIDAGKGNHSGINWTSLGV